MQASRSRKSSRQTNRWLAISLATTNVASGHSNTMPPGSIFTILPIIRSKKNGVCKPPTAGGGPPCRLQAAFDLRFSRARSRHFAAPDVTGRGAISSTEAAVEIGEIAEADIVGDRADRPLGISGFAQHAMRTLDALFDQEGRERLAVGLEQALEITRRHAELLGARCHRQVLPPAIIGDGDFGLLQPCRLDAAPPGQLPGLVGGTEDDCQKIVQMPDPELAQIWRRERLLPHQCLRIVDQQSKSC